MVRRILNAGGLEVAQPAISVVKAKGSVDASGGGQHSCDTHHISRRFLFVG